jgi:NIPSNAP
MKALFILLTMITTAVYAGQDVGIYELRTYYAAPGKLEELNARFKNHTMKLFEKHGIVNFGYWVPVNNTNNQLIYLLGYPDRDAARNSWKAFGSDPEWQKVVKASEANGKLVTRFESVFMKPTDYSPPTKNSVEKPPRTFELRRYKATPGNLEALNARFRDHTLTLFSKHGMAHYGYWVPVDKEKGADDTLIYILVHKSQDAAKQSFDAFRADPDWVAVRKASEEKAGGSLTVKVDSLFMKPTDYSPTK